VASADERATLASVAHALNVATAPHLPALILLTDEERLPDPGPAVRALPEGSAIIVRHREPAARSRVAGTLLPLARSKGLRLIVANDALLAERLGADGVHFSEARAHEAAGWRLRRFDWLITAAAHSPGAVAAAAESRADAALLSPVFATVSHPGREALGPQGVFAIASAAKIPVYALGGVTAHNAALLAAPNVAGIAAIAGLIPDD
jgi:thiamine-phosphate pyrophosphorylase